LLNGVCGGDGANDSITSPFLCSRLNVGEARSDGVSRNTIAHSPDFLAYAMPRRHLCAMPPLRSIMRS
jgi:hypothetical protein